MSKLTASKLTYSQQMRVALGMMSTGMIQFDDGKKQLKEVKFTTIEKDPYEKNVRAKGREYWKNSRNMITLKTAVDMDATERSRNIIDFFDGNNEKRGQEYYIRIYMRRGDEVMKKMLYEHEHGAKIFRDTMHIKKGHEKIQAIMLELLKDQSGKPEIDTADKELIEEIGKNVVDYKPFDSSDDGHNYDFDLSIFADKAEYDDSMFTKIDDKMLRTVGRTHITPNFKQTIETPLKRSYKRNGVPTVKQYIDMEKFNEMLI
jgi:hypothetical protein